MEVIVPSSCNPIVTCFNGKDGSVIWQSKTKGSDSPPTIADIDNDGQQEILFGEFGGFVICFDILTGNMEWEILVDKNSWIQTAPSVADFDGDNLPEIFFIGGKTDYPDVSENFGRGYCLSLKSGTGPDWLMFQNNIRRTGNSCDKTTGTDYSNLLIEIIISPNPATDYITININAIYPMLQSGVGDEVFAEIYDAMGVKIRSTQSASQPPLHDENFKIDISNLSPGVYFLKIMCSNVTLAIVEKFVKI